MNTFNYLNDGVVPRQKYPFSLETWEEIQKQILLPYDLAQLAGKNCILKGCVTVGAQTSAGVVIINGELLPFVAGINESKVRIRQVVDNVTAQYITYNNAKVRRWVEFGQNPDNVDTFVWADFVQIKTIAQLDQEKATHEEVQALQNLIMPTGIITMWSGSIQNIPDGWALCNGDNGTPDLQNKFIVGAGQQYSVTDVGGAASVALTLSQIPSHRHKIAKVSRDDGSDGGGDYMRQGERQINTYYDSFTDYQGGGQAHENRPPYYALAYIMKL